MSRSRMSGLRVKGDNGQMSRCGGEGRGGEGRGPWKGVERVEELIEKMGNEPMAGRQCYCAQRASGSIK